jgi:hypothetical protein
MSRKSKNMLWQLSNSIYELWAELMSVGNEMSIVLKGFDDKNIA